MRRLEAALQDLDLGAVYDMLSARAQGQLDASLSGWKDMNTRECLEAAADRMKSENPAAVKQIRRLAIVVMDIRPYGDRASAKVSVLLNGRDRTQTIPLVLEGGRWKIDTDAAMTDLPVDFAPDVSDANCVTFT